MEMNLKEGCEVYKIFSYPIRIRIINLFRNYEFVNIGDICRILNIHQTTAYMHVEWLRKTGGVEQRISTRYYFYGLNARGHEISEFILQPFQYNEELKKDLRRAANMEANLRAYDIS